MQHRNGFTLGQLIAVMLLLSLAIGLIVPIVLQWREASRRVQVISRHKQLGVAAHSYHDQHKRLPPAHDGSQSVLAMLLPFYANNTYILTNDADYSAPAEQRAKDPWTSNAINYYLVGSHADAKSDITAEAHYDGLPDPEPAKKDFGYMPLAIRDVGDGTSNTIMWVSCLARPRGQDVAISGEGSKPRQPTGPYTAWLSWESAPEVDSAGCASGKHAQSYSSNCIHIGVADGGARSLDRAGAKIYSEAMLPNDNREPQWHY
jgi:type II secretory pathway pseudopilin PulG